MKQGMLDMNIQTLASLETSINPRSLVNSGSTLHRQQVERHKHLSEWDQSYKDRLLEYYIQEEDKKRSLSPSRQVEIEAWRENITPRSDASWAHKKSQRHSAPPKKTRQNIRVMSSRSDSQTVINKKTYLTDTGKFVEKDEDFDSLMAHINQMSLHYEAQRKAIHDRILKGKKTETASPQPSAGSRNGWDKKPGTESTSSSRHSAGSERTATSSKYDGDTSSISEVDQLKLNTKSPSNNLLNCVTIDDSVSSQRQMYPLTDFTIDSDEEIINLRHSLPSRRSTRQSSAQTVQTLNNSNIFSNSAVSRAFDALLNYKDVQENTAISGLYKFRNIRTRPVSFGTESENFKKRKALLREQVSRKSLEKFRRPESQQRSLAGSVQQQTEHLSLANEQRHSRNSRAGENKASFLKVIMDDMEEDEDSADRTPGVHQ